MIGDGVEISRLPGYLTTEGGLNGGQATLITGTVYGLGVIIASWFSGTLSAIWGPQRVMQLGAAIWVVFEAIFLLFAINSGSLFFVGLDAASPTRSSPSGSWSGPRRSPLSR